jgi:hypothetical protein
MYSKRVQSIKAAFWTHIATFCSIIISAVISLRRGQLSFYHYMLAVQTAGSPMLFYMAIYAIRSWFGNQNRMDILIGKSKGHWNRYGVVSILALLVYIGFWVLAWNPGMRLPFAQRLCGSDPYWFELLSDPFSSAVGEIATWIGGGGYDYNFYLILFMIILRSLTGLACLIGIGIVWKRVQTSGPDTHRREKTMW